jgi:hypothetical protein
MKLKATSCCDPILRSDSRQYNNIFGKKILKKMDDQTSEEIVGHITQISICQDEKSDLREETKAWIKLCLLEQARLRS